MWGGRRIQEGCGCRRVVDEGVLPIMELYGWRGYAEVTALTRGELCDCKELCGWERAQRGEWYDIGYRVGVSESS